MSLNIDSENQDSASSDILNSLVEDFERKNILNEKSPNYLSFILQNEKESSKTDKIQISIKASKSSIIIYASAIQKLSKSAQHDQQFLMNIVQTANNNLSKDVVVYWEEQNKNFSVKKVLSLQGVKDKQQQVIILIKTSIDQLKVVISKCIEKVVNQKIQSLVGQQKAALSSIKKKFSYLQYLRYQFEVNRQKRSKTSFIDFNNSTIKYYEDLQSFKQKCILEKMNFHRAVIQCQAKSSINKTKAQQCYNKLLQNINKDQQQNKLNNVLGDAQKILNPIRIQSSNQINCAQKIEGTFSHIQVIQSQFSVIFSLNFKTNQFAKENHFNKIVQKKEKCVLIKKNKCHGCKGENQITKIINQTVFQNQKQMLIILNHYQHNSICNFYVQQYIQKNEITSIYSKKLPYNPLSTLFQNNLYAKRGHTLRKILNFTYQISQGIKFLSNQQIIHRDLKPTNVMLDQQGTAKIIDFGSSCPKLGSHFEHKLPQKFDYKLRSTKGYYFKYNQLPEDITKKYTKQQYQRHISFDIYSLGAILEYLLPNDIISIETTTKQNGWDIKLRQNIQYFIKKCKCIHPDDRITAVEATMFLKELLSLSSLLQNFDYN